LNEGIPMAWEYAHILIGSTSLMNPNIPLDKDEVMAVIRVNDRLQDFEHKPINRADLLNQMGLEGWELITVIPIKPPSPSAVIPRGLWEYILKRQR
jgi:hypothetical protein